MDTETRQLIDACVAASFAGTRGFGDIVGSLVAQGIESYRVDYREATTTYFDATTDPYVVAIAIPPVAIADAFDPDSLVAAIRGSQAGQVKYPEFLDRSMRAGCVGYVVWIAGRHVVYFGRRGEQHVERFPSAAT